MVEASIETLRFVPNNPPNPIPENGIIDEESCFWSRALRIL